MKKMATVFPDQKDTKRVPKPLMEKRRRDRINHSLETLRLLLLENTRNEKLKNPKVEKAEILESVVNFLRTEQEGEPEHQPMKRGHAKEGVEEEGSPCKRKQSYHEGMRSCLLRVSHFVATKTQELEDPGNSADVLPQRSPVGFSDLNHHPAPSSAQLHVFSSSILDQNPLPGQQMPQWQPPSHTGLNRNRPSQRIDLKSKESPSTSKLCMEPSDAVWRPWPQE